ncbi:MAG: hypothetical protein ACOCXJ_02065 [Planctomycetota bacterium]
MRPRIVQSLVVLVATLALGIGGCTRQTPPASDTARSDLRTRMQRMEGELQAMQAELTADLAAAERGVGRGAYASGPMAIAGTETVLERLHRTQEALQTAQAALDERSRTIVQLRRAGDQQEERIGDLSAKAERLDRAESQRITAIQERNATLADYERLRELLIATELARLERERDFYDLITEVIALDPGHTQEFFALQQGLKEVARNLAHPPDTSGAVALPPEDGQAPLSSEERR